MSTVNVLRVTEDTVPELGWKHQPQPVGTLGVGSTVSPLEPVPLGHGVYRMLLIAVSIALVTAVWSSLVALKLLVLLRSSVAQRANAPTTRLMAMM
jgi:hypothetical protein